jgi:hypothetical protein
LQIPALPQGFSQGPPQRLCQGFFLGWASRCFDDVFAVKVAGCLALQGVCAVQCVFGRQTFRGGSCHGAGFWLLYAIISHVFRFFLLCY